MNTKYLKALQKARVILGGTTALAAACGVTPPTVSEWFVSVGKKTPKRRIPLTRCSDIERATGGQVTCEELRPDFDWAFLRGTKK